MLLVLFGIPGAGKSFIGQMLMKKGYYFYEADTDLTPIMINAVKQERLFTDAMRDEFFRTVINHITVFKQKHKKIVVAQALAKEKNRHQILKQFPDAQFIWVNAAPHVIKARLSMRSDWVSFSYAEKIRQIFDSPKIPHILLDNNKDITHLQQQLVSQIESDF